MGSQAFFSRAGGGRATPSPPDTVITYGLAPKSDLQEIKNPFRNRCIALEIRTGYLYIASCLISGLVWIVVVDPSCMFVQ